MPDKAYLKHKVIKAGVMEIIKAIDIIDQNEYQEPESGGPVEVEYFEYECGHPCTPNGCMGHTTNIPVGIEIDGVWFYVQGYEGGDYPGDGKMIKAVQRSVAHLKAMEKAEKTQIESDKNDMPDM